MKTTLSIEQSARLIELGVDANLASDDKVTYDKNDKPYCHPIYTLTDLLSILPKEIDGYELNISTTKQLYFVSYILWDWVEDYGSYVRDNTPDAQFSAPELIDSLYQLLIWCLEQGYCKCGKGGGK